MKTDVKKPKTPSGGRSDSGVHAEWVQKVTNVLSVGKWTNANDLKKAEEVSYKGVKRLGSMSLTCFRFG